MVFLFNRTSDFLLLPRKSSQNLAFSPLTTLRRFSVFFDSFRRQSQTTITALNTWCTLLVAIINPSYLSLPAVPSRVTGIKQNIIIHSFELFFSEINFFISSSIKHIRSGSMSLEKMLGRLGVAPK